MPEPPDRNTFIKSIKRLIGFTVFVCGAATMAIEFGASRLLGNIFGTSNIVWAVIIGLVLVYLSLGYSIGGRLVDKRPDYGLFYRLIGFAGAFIAVVPLVSRPVLRASANAFDALNLPILAGSFTAVLLLFSVPVTLLGMVPPFALRLSISEASKAGKTSGTLSALSTAGSFLGTFLMVLVAIPKLGTHRSFLLIALMLLSLASFGSFFVRSVKQAIVFAFFGFVTTLLFLLGPLGGTKASVGQIYETESSYNYIQVLEKDGYRYLRLNEGQGVHSVWHPSEVFYGGPWSQFLLAPLFNPGDDALPKVDDIAILGLAAGTIARQASLVYPEASIDGVEIDPEILNVGIKYFELDQIDGLQTYAQDARWFIHNTQKQYDLIIIDAYKPPYIPAHLVTLEFFKSVHEKLQDDGIAAINVGRSPTDYGLVDGLASTMAMVYPQIFAIELPNSYNTILIACKNPAASWKYFERRLKQITTDSANNLLLRAGQIARDAKAEPRTDCQIFTDDKAPIEWMTNRLVLNFLFDENFNR